MLSFGFNQFFGALRVFFFALGVGNGYVRAFAGEVYGYGSPDTAVAPGDQGYFSIKLIRPDVVVFDDFRLWGQFRFDTRLHGLVLRRNLYVHNVVVGLSQ